MISPISREATLGKDQRQTVALDITDVCFRYATRDATGEKGTRVWTVNHLTLHIHQQEIFTIIGPNGSGKSTVLKMLSRLLVPERGEIRCFGESLTEMTQQDLARRMAFVPQDHAPLFPFTLAETVLMGRYAHHQPRWNFSGFGWETHQDRKVAEQALHEMDLGHLAHRSITEVSGGERQRAYIARALAQEPDIILLDEITTFLDVKHQLDMCRLLLRLNRERGLTIVVVSHDLNLASEYSDRLLLLHQGEPFQLGTPEKVIRKEVLEPVYGCSILVDRHPESGLPRVTLPGRPGE